MTDAGLLDRCQGATGPCDRMATETVATVNGWLIDLCHRCALALCDPLR